MLVNIFYFFPQFQGKVMKQGDIIQYTGMSKEQSTYSKQSGREVLWTNAMFGGMPTYQIGINTPSNLLQYIRKPLSLFFNMPAGYFITGMLSFYLLMILLGINPWLGLLGALIFGFSTNNLILMEAGHNAKLDTIFLSPLVIAGVLLVFREKYLLGAGIFGISFGLNVFANHPQMTYYLGLCLAILVAIQLYHSIKEKKLSSFAKGLAVLVVVGLIGLGSSASRLWTTYEYAKDTMRGEPILKATDSATPASSSETNGLAWDYAMQWSNGAGDILATIIPKAVGGGSGEWLDGKSALGKAVGQRQEFQAPTYWGALPFTSGPAYLGVIAVFLFILGLFIVKGPIKWWLGSVVLLTMLMSMGKHFEFFNHLLFDYLPFYNKFRAPSSILSITAIFIPILGIKALSDMVESKNREQYIRPLLISAGILGGISSLLWLGGSSFFDFNSPGDAQYEQIKDALLDQRASMLSSSAMRSLVLIMLSAGVLWMFLKDKINRTVMLACLAVFCIFDLVQIDRDYFSKKNFVTTKNYANEFTPRPVDTQILQDPDPYFRVYDASVNTFNSASTSYFHKTIGGYHAAKLQRYDDIITRHISNNNQTVLNMLNTKYFIIPIEGGEPAVKQNPGAMGNAWFVDNIRVVPDANAEIDSLTSFDPASVAFVHAEFKDYVEGLNPSKNGTILLKSYDPEKLEFESQTEGDQLAVFSDVWYGPGKGWQSYIDGQPVDHIRVNYLLRGLKVPSGKHTITFEFKPKAYYLGENISLASSLLLIGMLLFVIFKLIKGENNSESKTSIA
ncbi:MAG: YfhO family protein [Saprospiraceae bacterium]